MNNFRTISMKNLAALCGVILALSLAGCGDNTNDNNNDNNGGGDPVEPRAWSKAVALDSAQAYDVRMSFDADGNGFAVWRDLVGPSGAIYAQRYDAATGWAATAEAISVNDAAEPQVAFLPNGEAIAVWSENPVSGGGQLVIKVHTPGSGWGAQTTLGDGYNYGAHLVTDQQGKATVVWSEADGAWTSRYSAGTWSAPYQLTDAAYAGTPEVAVDAEGNIMAVWIEDPMGDSTLWHSRYDAAGDTWSVKQLFDSVASGSSTDQAIGVDGTGNFMVVWWQSTASDDNVYQRRWSAATDAWGAKARLNGAGTWGYAPVLAVSANGDAVAAWEEWDGSNDNVSGTVYTSGSGWATPQHIDSPHNDMYGVAVAIDATGNALAIWIGCDAVTGDPTSIWANGYTAADGWGTPVALREKASVSYDGLQLHVSPQDDVAAFWTEDNVPYTARFE